MRRPPLTLLAGIASLTTLAAWSPTASAGTADVDCAAIASALAGGALDGAGDVSTFVEVVEQAPTAVLTEAEARRSPSSFPPTRPSKRSLPTSLTPSSRTRSC